MRFKRRAGVLLHPSSLPGTGGVGDLGPQALRFVNWLEEAGAKIWQMLPLGPTGFGNSPYQCFSAFAGNPLLIHVPGWSGPFPLHTVDFAVVLPEKARAREQWLKSQAYDGKLDAFVSENAYWLNDFALFMSLKEAHGHTPWWTWEAKYAQRDSAALESWRGGHEQQIRLVCSEQYVFHEQFMSLKQHCMQHGVDLMGDLPIYVAHDSADVWSRPELFTLNPDGTLRVQSGVPPDYFSETGQRWGNPLYNWDVMREQNYEWWTARVRRALSLFDIIRLDHFRGFEAFWEIPGDAPTAVEGRWRSGPGAALFDALKEALGQLPVVAEDLGYITPEVEALRDQLEFPGMCVLQFAFSDPASPYLPHHHTINTAVYTGTHDNDTTIGWWRGANREFAMEYMERPAADDSRINQAMIRCALASVADTAVIPMQDILGLGSEARMNMPSRESNNWRFRFSWDQLKPDATAELRRLARLYDR